MPTNLTINLFLLTERLHWGKQYTNKESQSYMGTVMLHFRGSKIARFVCDANISHIWGKGDNRQKKKRCSKYSITGKCCTRFFLDPIKLNSLPRVGRGSCVSTQHYLLDGSTGGLGGHRLYQRHLLRLKVRLWLVSFSRFYEVIDINIQDINSTVKLLWYVCHKIQCT